MIPKLENLFIYPTWSCNLNCKHCWVDKNKDLSRLSINVLETAISEAISLGLKYIKISGGEPLLCKDLTRKVIELACENKIQLSIETNGTLINDDWVSLFKNCDALVSISIDSFDENIHDEFRGKKGAFALSINAIRQLVEQNVRVGIVTSISNVDESSLYRIIEFANDLSVSNLKINPIVKIGNADQQNGENEFIFTLSPEEMIYLKNQYCNNKINKMPVSLMLPVGLTSVRNIISPEAQSWTCANCPTLNLLSILPNGDIGLCADASRTGVLLFGNLFEDNIINIWNSSDILKNLRDEVPEKLQGVCGKCMVRDICKGSCRAISIKAGGQLNSPHPICQKLYEENKFFLAKKDGILL